LAEAASQELVASETEAGGLLPGLSSLAPLKQLGILIAIAASIALGVYIALWSKEPPLRPLGNLEPAQAMDVINYLEQNQIEYHVDTNGNILVPQSRYQRIQMELAAQGVVVEGSGEDAFLKKDTGFGVSQRLERARLLRNQELALTNTLQQFAGVKAAKVHLAIPKESSFIKNRKKPSASVLLNLYSRGGLSDEQVEAIVDLVSSSVPNLERDRVTITDQFGRLYHSGSMDSSHRELSKEQKIIKQKQNDLKSRIESILTPIVGAASFTVEVNVDMDFTKKEQTLQTFNPDLPAVRSERTIEDSSGQGTAAGIPGALSNQPPGASQIPTQANAEGTAEAGTVTNLRREAERNYDLDTTIAHIVPQTGVVRRVSASIGIDYMPDPDNPGEKIPRPQADIERITNLVRAAIGYDVQRGDIVTVDSFPFVSAESLPEPVQPAFYETELFHTLLKPLVGLILGIMLIFMVLRPTLQKLSTPPPVIGTELAVKDDELDISDLTGEPVAGAVGGEGDVTLAGHENLELPPPTVGQIKKLEQAKGVVENNPTLVAQLVKNWINEDG